MREHATALRWLDEQADAWLHEIGQTGRIPASVTVAEPNQLNTTDPHHHADLLGR